MTIARLTFAAAVLLGFTPSLLAQSTPIATARTQADGTTVTVTGTVSRAKGRITYIQDGTAGIAVFQTTGTFFDAVAGGTVAPGCSVTVTGKLAPYRGLSELADVSTTQPLTFTVGTCGQPVTPQVVTASEVIANGEAYESELIRVTGLTFVTTPTGPLAAATTYPANDGTANVDVRIPSASDSDVDGQAAPPPPFTFEGVLGQFLPTGATTGGYQLLPVNTTDLVGNPSVQPNVAFGTASAAVSEASGTYAVTVALDRVATADVTAALAVTGGTAAQGTDYTVPSPFSVTIPAGQTSGTATITVADDGVTEGSETVTLSLSVTSGPATLGSPSTFSLTINDPTTAPGANSVCPNLTGASLLTCIRTNYARTNPRSYSSRTSFYSSYYGAGPYRCVYSGRSAPLGSSGDTETNTEHTFPQSKMPSQGTQDGDMHNLYITIASVNSDRGNLAFGEVADASATNWYGPTGTFGGSAMPTANIEQYSERGGGVFEPREDHKGNVVRAIAYFYALYGTNDESFWTANKPILMSWNTLDPADNEERARSTAIKTYQGNENPFILDPTLIERAFFWTTASENETTVAGASVHVSPNPTRGRAVVAYRVPATATVTVEVYDVTGRRVAAAAPQAVAAGQDAETAFDLAGMTPGVYLYRVSAGAWTTGGTFVLAR